jgi:hypothetical protein
VNMLIVVDWVTRMNVAAVSMPCYTESRHSTRRESTE